MSVTVVGSIAFDAVTTPFGSRERMLGGSAVHFGLAASFFDQVHIVGPVGDDFGDQELAVLEGRRIETADIERVDGGRTFFWRGVYGWDLNDRETLDTQLNVFAEFQPKLSGAVARSRRPVPREHPARPPARGPRAVRRRAVRRAGLDEPVDRDRARLAGRRDLRGRLPDAQRRRAAPAHAGAESRAGRAADPRVGPARGRRQAGRVRRGDGHRGGVLRAARVPAGDGRRSDRAPATASPAASSATSRRTRRRSSTTSCCAARWPTGPRSRRSTSRSSGPNAWRV